MSRRIERVNALLQQVISEVIHKEIKNKELPPFVTVTEVDTSKDLQHAKVYISVIGDQKAKDEALRILTQAASYIRYVGSKKVTMRYFPDLLFCIDDTVEKQMKIAELLHKIEEERESRNG